VSEVLFTKELTFTIIKEPYKQETIKFAINISSKKHLDVLEALNVHVRF